MGVKTKVSQKEISETVSFWREHIKLLEKNKSLDEESLVYLRNLTKADNIGYDQNEIRPGKLGQWDIYYLMFQFYGLNQSESILASGLSAGEVANEQRKEELRSYLVDPDNEQEVREFEVFQSMTPEEKEKEIQRLKNLLK